MNEQVSKLRDEIKRQSLADKLHKQGLQLNLQEIYKPLIESQVKASGDIKSSIIQKLNNISNFDNRRWLQFLETFKNYPELIRGVESIKANLDTRLTDIINEIRSGHDTEALHKLDDIEEQQDKLEKVLNDIRESPTSVRLLPLIKKTSQYSLWNIGST